MPELPEVEVVKRSLERKILHLAIKKVTINDGNLRYKINKKEILNLIGRKFIEIKRRSKFLIFKLNKDFYMLVHLGMTGKFFYIDRKKKKFKTSFYYDLNYKKDQKHDRVIFYFSNDQKLIYNDIRKFGFIKFVKKKKFLENIHLRNLGPEPLEKKYNFLYLKKYMNGRKRNVKNTLMDQRCVSGLGNIYVNEILFFSGINPKRKVKNLNDSEISRIIKNTKKILKNSIKLGGSSIKDFYSDDGKKGEFQQLFAVYGRKGEICSNIDCKKKISKIVISNRASFYCRRCQK